MPRNLRPRATASLVVAPVTATDRTAPAVFGLEPDVFRDVVRKLGCRHIVSGKRMIVVVADFVAAIERAGGAEWLPADTEDHDVDSLLARLGRTRVARRKETA